MTFTQYAVARFYSQTKAAALAPTIERYRAEEPPGDRPSPVPVVADPPRSLSACYFSPLLRTPSEIAAFARAGEWERQRVERAERLLK